MCFQLFVAVLCLSLFCYALLCVHFSFAIILKRKRKLVALFLLSYRCIVIINVLWLFLTVPFVSLQRVIVVFLDHTHLLFEIHPYRFYYTYRNIISMNANVYSILPSKLKISIFCLHGQPTTPQNMIELSNYYCTFIGRYTNH